LVLSSRQDALLIRQQIQFQIQVMHAVQEQEHATNALPITIGMQRQERASQSAAQKAKTVAYQEMNAMQGFGAAADIVAWLTGTIGIPT